MIIDKTPEQTDTWMKQSPTEDGGPDMRMTAKGAEDLYGMLSRARPDWSDTLTWRVVVDLKRDFTHYPYTAIVIAALCVAHSREVASPEAILLDGRHWDNVMGYLAGASPRRQYADSHSAGVIEQARMDAKRITPGGQGPSAGYLAAAAALASRRASR